MRSEDCTYAIALDKGSLSAETKERCTRTGVNYVPPEVMSAAVHL